MRQIEHKIRSILFSGKSTIILLCIFFVVIATATFIENRYDTFTAKVLVYNAKWFEGILVLLALNFIGNIKRYTLFHIEKLASLILHMAFITMIIGAGITRYFGFQADMHIREGESTNIIYSSEPYFQLQDKSTEYSYYSDKPAYFSQIGNKSKQFNLEFKNKPIEVKIKDYIKHAEEYLIPQIGETDAIELSHAQKDGDIKTIYIRKGELKNLGNIIVSYDNNTIQNSVNIIVEDNQLFILSPFSVRVNKKSEMVAQIINKDSINSFKENHVYSINGEMFLFVKHHKNAKIKWTHGNPDDSSIDVLVAIIKKDEFNKEIELFYDNEKYIQTPANIQIKNNEYEITYGPKPIEIPFSIKLNDFILTKYPGSEIPSSYLSMVTLTDDRYNLREQHNISKNNILDYKGYRFFQTFYDEDEKGTILSVNHDFYGTLISYIGYFMLVIGFIVLLFSKKSRFTKLGRMIQKVRLERKAFLTSFLVLISLSVFSNDNSQNYISKYHSDKFGKLLVKTYDGRFAPVNSLAHDVIHKISKKDNITVAKIGRMDAMQVFANMFHNSEFWKQQEIIYIGDKSIRDILGIKNKHTSFNTFFNQQNRYVFENQLRSAIDKKPKNQSRFDKEIIKLTERIDICIMTYNGTFLKIFPEQNSINNKWINWNDPEANKQLTGKLEMLNDDFQISNLSYRNIMQEYVNTVIEAQKTGNYSRPNQILAYIENIQRQSVPKDLLPTRIKINLETFYNKTNIFIKLKYIYALLGFVLMIFSIVKNFNRKKSKLVQLAVKFLVAFLVLAFAYHTFGLGLRWYLSNHAPWSNGYETLLLVAWGTLLAGFTFTSHSKITLSGTAILAFLILMTAGHSYYDPQLTNLQPVLKSYWLIFHVATITIGYAFLGLGFILGIINLNMFLFKSKKKHNKISLIILELSYINEKSLFIGLFLTTVGTFLGGIWANESWGRYWGWDPKETWSLIIILVYAIVLHFRLIPKMKSKLLFNIGSVIAFSSVLMTFFGLNYYFRKSLHSYASDDPPVFPLWAWVIILSLIALIIAAVIKEKNERRKSS